MAADAIAVAFALAAAPYIFYVAQYGSPTPETPAQIALIENGARAAGWADLPRKSFPGYVAYFVVAFVADWMPALGARNVFNTPCWRFRSRLSSARSPVRAVAAPAVAPAG